MARGRTAAKMSQGNHDIAPSTGGSGKRRRWEAPGSLVGPLRGRATWRTSVDPGPRLPQPPEGGGDPCQSDLGPKAPQGNLAPVNLRGEGTPAKATWHPERSRESRAAAQGWGTPQAFRAPAWPLPPSRKPGRSVGGSNQLWHFDPPFDLHLRDARHVGGGPSAPCAFSAGSPLAPFGPCPDPRRAQPGPP